MTMFKKILAPTDGTKLSLKAVDKAIELAKETGASLAIVTVAPPYPATPVGDGYMLDTMSIDAWDKAMKRNSDRILAAAAKRAQAKGVVVTLLTANDNPPYAGILAVATKRKCDLIVMASHGRGSLSALLLGSETMKVLTHSRIPVLVCR